MLVWSNTGLQARTTPESETSAADEKIACAMVLRKNWSYLYQHLDTSHILQPLLDSGIVTEDVRKQVQSYVPKYAQNIVLVENLIDMKGTGRVLNILIAATGQEHIGQKLTEGTVLMWIYYILQNALTMFSDENARESRVWGLWLHLEQSSERMILYRAHAAAIRAIPTFFSMIANPICSIIATFKLPATSWPL